MGGGWRGVWLDEQTEKGAAWMGSKAHLAERAIDAYRFPAGGQVALIAGDRMIMRAT